MRRRTCRRLLFYIPLAMHREAANAQAHLQTTPVLHTDGSAPGSCQCADALADGACFTCHWLCTEKPPMRRHTCRRRLNRNDATCLFNSSIIVRANAQRNVRYAVPELACRLPPTTRAHGKCAYAMCHRMPNRPQLKPAGMSAQPQRKHNAHKVRPARVRRLRHPKREEAARCCQRAAPALSVMRACASVASLIRLLDRGLMRAVQPVAGMRAAVQEVYAMMA